jgi:hypothetical protein
MSNIRLAEQRAREAILGNIIKNYKSQHTNWLDEPAIKKAIMVYSFFRLENALIFFFTILAVGFCLTILSIFTGGLAGGIAGVVAFLMGVVLELIFLNYSLKDEKHHAQAVADLFKVEFTPARLDDKNLKGKVDKALEYWELIADAVERIPPGVLRDRLERTTQEVTHWLQAVYNLAERVDKFRLNQIVRRDLQQAPIELETYRRKLAQEDDPVLRRQLEQTVADKERQLQTLRDLEQNMEKADYQLESTISSLGTIYSQLLLVGDKDEQGGRISRLQEEVSEQINRLEDLAQAMDEVYEEAS